MNNNLPVKIAQCELTTNSATFNPAMPWADWLEAGQQLCKVAGATLWWIGDWINYGEKAYGEKYAQALGLLDYDAQTLRNAAYVSSNVTLRLQGLTWSHHREVAPMNQDKQAQWLNKAATNQWTVSELRQHIRREQAEFKDDDNEPKLGLFKWVDTAFELDRYLKAEAQKQDPTKWSAERKERVKEVLAPIVSFYSKL